MLRAVFVDNHTVAARDGEDGDGADHAGPGLGRWLERRRRDCGSDESRSKESRILSPNLLDETSDTAAPMAVAANLGSSFDHRLLDRGNNAVFGSFRASFAGHVPFNEATSWAANNLAIKCWCGWKAIRVGHAELRS